MARMENSMILITGGLGFIGTHATRALIAAGEKCVVISRGEAAVPRDLSPLLGRSLFHVRADVADTERMRVIAAEHAVTGILHLAFGSPFPPSGDSVADIRAGVASLLGILQVGIELGVDRVGVASSIGVYGGAEVRGSATEDLPLPLVATHPIPAMKKIGELVSNQIAAASGLSLYNARIAGVWGPGGRADARFFGAPQLVHAAAAGRDPDFSALPMPPRRDDGADLIYASDCGEALARLQLAPTLEHTVYNVGSGRSTTYGDLVSAITAVVPEFSPSLSDGSGGAAVVEDIARLRADTGFAPLWDTGAAIRDYLGWLRAGNSR
jgi:UDP-glucose 4-epimerase